MAVLWIWPYLPMLRGRLLAGVRAASSTLPHTVPMQRTETPAAADTSAGAPVRESAPLRFVYEMIANERPLDYLRLVRTQWRHEHLDDSEPYIEIGVWLRYAGIYPLDIARELTGGVGYAGRTFNLAPQPGAAEPPHLERGQEVVLLIHQHLFDFEAATLRTALITGNEVELTTDTLRISAHTVMPPEVQPSLVGYFEIGPRVSNRDPEDRAGEF